jgi:hypothetical protein
MIGKQVLDHVQKAEEHLHGAEVVRVHRHHQHRRAGFGRDKEEDAVELDDDHRRQRAEGDQTEAVEHRIAATDGRRQADAHGGQQRRSDRRSDDAARIEGQTDQFRRRKRRQANDDQEVRLADFPAAAVLCSQSIRQSCSGQSCRRT